MATRLIGGPPNPLSVGGHWRLTKVSWSNGIFIRVSALAFYIAGVPGSRSASITITGLGAQAGGAILKQQNLHVINDPNQQHHTEFTALLKFSRAPKGNGATFLVNLSGSIVKEDTQNPGTAEPPFCGTSSASATYSRFLTHNFGGTQVWQHTTLTFSSPAESGTISFDTELQAVKEAVNDVPTGLSGSSTSIWYKDSFGNFINTGRPCDDIGQPGDGNPTTNRRVEGWASVDCVVFPATEFSFKDGDLAIKPNVEFPGPIFSCGLPSTKAGFNSDNRPIFDDLASGGYAYRHDVFSFSKLPSNDPKANFKEFGVYLFSGPGRYFYAAGTTAKDGLHNPLPPESLFLSGVAPQTDQEFD